MSACILACMDKMKYNVLLAYWSHHALCVLPTICACVFIAYTYIQEIPAQTRLCVGLATWNDVLHTCYGIS